MAVCTKIGTQQWSLHSVHRDFAQRQDPTNSLCLTKASSWPTLLGALPADTVLVTNDWVCKMSQPVLVSLTGPEGDFSEFCWFLDATKLKKDAWVFCFVKTQDCDSFHGPIAGILQDLSVPTTSPALATGTVYHCVHMGWAFQQEHKISLCLTKESHPISLRSSLHTDTLYVEGLVRDLHCNQAHWGATLED